MFRDITKLGLQGAQAPPPKRLRGSLKLGRESVFMHCCFGHHAVVIGGYLFVVFCIVDIIVQTVLTCRNALQQDGRGYTSVFTIGPCCSACSMAQVAKKASASGDFVPQSPHQSFANGPHWHTRRDFRSSTAPVPLAALSGNKSAGLCNECFSLSLRLYFSNDIAEAGWVDDTDKNFGPDLPLLLLFKMDEIWSVASQENY